MSFEVIAPHYRWMEFLSAGPKLQRCRTAFLSEVADARNVLLLGEGNGRFLESFLEANKTARVVCVDGSARMLTYARLRCRSDRVEFIHADALEWNFSSAGFDLVVTNFFLDCFPPESLKHVIQKVAAVSVPGARWLVTDFQEADGILAGFRSRVILRAMYFFFRAVTALPASRLTEPDPFLEEAGFKLLHRRTAEWGLLRSDLWQRA